MAEPGMKVGELASRTGLSVRTLHHYDAIGLLRPARRTPSGHRLYGMDEVRRLHQIASLRQLGLSLEEIRASLDGPGYTLEEVLGLHVRRVRDEIRRQSRLVDRLEALRRRIAQGKSVTVDDVTGSIHATLDLERYYTPEQLRDLSRRREAMGPGALEAARRDWEALFEAVADARARGVDPASGEARALARRASALIQAFTGGDEGVRASLERLYRQGGSTRVMASAGMDVPDEVMAYYREIMALSASRDGR